MKRTLLIAAMIMAMAGCSKTQPPGTVQQCGFDSQTNETKCIYVPVNQIQTGQMAQPMAPQVVQAAPVQYAPVPQTVVVHDSGAGNAMAGIAAGMMIGSALNNNGGSRYDAPQTAVNKTVVNKTYITNQAPQAAPSAPVVAPLAVASTPSAVAPLAVPTPLKTQSLTIPVKAPSPNFAPAPIVAPTYAKAAPMQVSSSSGFTATRPSATSTSGFKRK
jgi:hypothetical protein